MAFPSPAPLNNAKFPLHSFLVVPDAMSLPAWCTAPQPRACSGGWALLLPWAVALPAEPGQPNWKCQSEWIFKLLSFFSLTE